MSTTSRKAPPKPLHLQFLIAPVISLLEGRSWAVLEGAPHQLALAAVEAGLISSESDGPEIMRVAGLGDIAAPRPLCDELGMIDLATEYSYTLMGEGCELDRLHKLGELIGFVRHVYDCCG